MSEFANPILELCSKELFKGVRESASEFFEEVFKGKHKDQIEAAKLEKDYAQTITKAEQLESHSLTHSAEESKTQQQSKPKSKDKTYNKPSPSIQTASNGDYIVLPDDKKYYDLGDLKTLDDYLDNPFQPSSASIFKITTHDKKVYTLIPYANAAASPNITYTDLSLIGETGLGLAIRYGVPIARTLAPYAARGLGIVGTALLVKETAEFAWEGTKTLAQIIFYPETLIGPQSSSQQLLDQDIRARKDAHKISLYSTATATMTFNKCWIKALPVEGKAQALVDLADKIDGHIDRVLYSSSYVIGTLKHKALHEIHEVYQKICNDYTFKSEVAVQNGTIYDERPNPITGASIVDLITALPYAKDTYYAFDAKFGSADVTEASIRKLVKNIAPEKVVIWQVKPSRMFKTEIKYPKFNSINLNQ